MKNANWGINKLLEKKELDLLATFVHPLISLLLTFLVPVVAALDQDCAQGTNHDHSNRNRDDAPQSNLHQEIE